MIAAGLAMNVLTIENNKIMTCSLYAPPSDVFYPIIYNNGKLKFYNSYLNDFRICLF